MKLSANIIRFNNEFGIEKTIDIFAEAGFEAIDFNCDLQEYYNDSHEEAFYRNLREYAYKKGITFAQTHAPFSSSYDTKESSDKRFEEIVRSMRHSSWLGAEMIVIHPCKHIDYTIGNNRNTMMEYNLDFYKRLIPHAKEYNIKIAIENIGGSITETPEGLLELLDALDNDVFTICYDIGHAQIRGQNPSEMIKKLGKRIGCTHIHDNDGVHDSHTLPYYGVIDWESATKAFAEVGYDGNFSYEASMFLDKIPVDFRPEGLKYMARVGRYLIDKIEKYR